MEVVSKDLRVMDLTAITFCKDNGLPILVFDLMGPGKHPKGPRRRADRYPGPVSLSGSRRIPSGDGERVQGDHHRYAGLSMDDDLTALVVAEARERMEKAVDHTQAEFGSVRTGRATPGAGRAPQDRLLRDREPELRQLAGFSVPEARLLIISPYDKGRSVPSRRRSRARTWASSPPTTAT